MVPDHLVDWHQLLPCFEDMSFPVWREPIGPPPARKCPANDLLEPQTRKFPPNARERLAYLLAPQTREPASGKPD